MQKTVLSKFSTANERNPTPIIGHDMAVPARPSISFSNIQLGYLIANIAAIGLVIPGLLLTKIFLVVLGLLLTASSVMSGIGLIRVKAPEKSIRKPCGIELPLPEPADIWRTYPCLGETEVSLRIALISRNMGQSGNIGTSLAGSGHEVHHSTDCDAMLESVRARAQDWALVIFDLDSMPNLESGLDDLLEFRGACPDVQVLLLTSDAQQNDFSRHHGLIADATLRKFILETTLLEVLKAVNNNFKASHLVTARTSTRPAQSIQINAALLL